MCLSNITARLFKNEYLGWIYVYFITENFLINMK